MNRLALLLLLVSSVCFAQNSTTYGPNGEIYMHTPNATYGPNGQTWIHTPGATGGNTYIIQSQPAPRIGSDPSIYNQMRQMPIVPLEPRQRR